MFEFSGSCTIGIRLGFSMTSVLFNNAQRLLISSKRSGLQGHPGVTVSSCLNGNLVACADWKPGSLDEQGNTQVELSLSPHIMRSPVL